MPAGVPKERKSGRLNWVRDFLGHDFPDARILNFGHNADWFVRAPVMTASDAAMGLLRELKRQRRKDVCESDELNLL